MRSVDLASGSIALSDGSGDRLDPASLRVSTLDADALLCTVKRDLVAHGLPARFTRSAQAELLLGVEEGAGGFVLHVAGAAHAVARTLTRSRGRTRRRSRRAARHTTTLPAAFPNAAR